jgi:glucosamine-6-phosphate deaminase
MGIGTILEAREVVLVAVGEGKAPIVARLLTEPVSPLLPASFLALHPASRLYLDAAASSLLGGETAFFHTES